MHHHQDFSGGSDGKMSVYNTGDLGSIPGLGRFPGEGNDNLLQYSCLENPMDGGAWCPWGHKESHMTERLHLGQMGSVSKAGQKVNKCIQPSSQLLYTHTHTYTHTYAHTNYKEPKLILLSLI